MNAITRFNRFKRQEITAGKAELRNLFTLLHKSYDHPPLDEDWRGEAALRDGFPARMHCFKSFSNISSEMRGYLLLIFSFWILSMMLLTCLSP
ncbi:hypothetical protein [Erwinia psidii]|uniref:Uncharacterized protein n=1 Tax=Erwinia psidii TaxID=69224 RepID=A0A3N6SEL8_9GAMM|nr:hypothetical protein [Erwinia psidii]MCX8964986.1 hypothetical protein [Erwinia psidii]RQM39880.1 hypothetical protein EB241_00770 [Erwinia psidii]